MNRQVIEKQGPLMTEMIEGEPIRVGERELTPLVRVTSRVHFSACR